jgi:type IV pilus assembly protein PilY1
MSAMNSFTRFLGLIALVSGLVLAPSTFAQTLLTEDFTGATSSANGAGVGNWLFFNGACLTAGSSANLVSPAASIPACTAVLNSYYINAQDGDRYLVGGNNGFLGGTSAPGSPTLQQADPVGSGALRFTNGKPYGNQERGAIVSTNAYSTTAGIQVTFKTTTYDGTGADGISFYLMDGCVPVAGAIMPSSCVPTKIYPSGAANVPAIGGTGGSLAFSCSDTNGPSSGTGVTYDGLTGGYLGLGIDEYGNFLNQGDNTASGYGFQPGRIGLRGAGAISWPALNNAYGTNPGSSSKPYYPSTLSASAQQSAIQKTCSSGHLWNYANAGNPTDAGAATLANAANTASVLDYAAIPGAYTILPSGNPISNGGAATRGAATTIFYNLKITSDGYLSLSYAYNGGAYQSVIANQNIQTSNGALPNFVRFGFAGSTGGATNVHEIMCFKSAPNVQSGSSAGVNEQQTAQVQSGTFAYFAYYDPNNWVGRVTANALSTDTNGNVILAATPIWDASCVLTGVIAGQTCSTGVAGPTAAMTPSSRTILTYNGGGVSFEWGSLSGAQQSALDTGDSTSTQYRLNYLRGDRTNEITTAGTCTYAATSPCFRARTSVLADIVDSSPTWVGPPQLNYTATWQDLLNPGTAMPENAGQSYSQYMAAELTRPNIVYIGSNDGMMHGFRSGSDDASGNFTTATTPNDGQEVIAYVPGSLLLSPSTGGACASLATTGSVVQNIHGLTPAYMSQAACVTSALDFSSTQYGHNFFVDATPGTGDLYYSGAWHTWLVSGLGAGGAAIFALDVTNPTAGNFVEGHASSLVVGEWTASTITCAGNTTCGASLGNTYGTPLIRRLHDGRWAVIFGNGYGSSSGDAGIFVMTVDSSGNKLFYYLSTGNTGTGKNNGIGYVAAADLDGDHITDYVYAGDLMGNLWKFDLTSSTESAWQVATGPLFKTAAGQPITTQVTASSGTTSAGGSTLVITFGTGQRTQFTNAAQASFATATQSLYSVWDWNMSAWNAKSNVQYAALTTTGSGLTAPNFTLAPSNLQPQAFTLNADGSTRDINSPTAICWAGAPGCTGAAGKFGWYINLIGAKEQFIYNPLQLDGVLIINSIVPANNVVTACTTNTDSGITYAISVLTGTSPPNFFIGFHDTAASGVQLNAVGTMYTVTAAASGNGTVTQTTTAVGQKVSGVYQTTTGGGGVNNFQLPPNEKGRRLSWVELR